MQSASFEKNSIIFQSNTTQILSDFILYSNENDCLNLTSTYNVKLRKNLKAAERYVGGGKYFIYDQLENMGYFLPNKKSRVVTLNYVKGVSLHKYFFIAKKFVKPVPKNIINMDVEKIVDEIQAIVLLYQGFGDYYPDKKWAISVLFSIMPHHHIFNIAVESFAKRTDESVKW